MKYKVHQKEGEWWLYKDIGNDFFKQTYPTLETDSLYWQSKQGQLLEEGKDFEVKPSPEGWPRGTEPTMYAVSTPTEPDLWEQAKNEYYKESGGMSFAPQAFKLFHWLKSHYTLTRK